MTPVDDDALDVVAAEYILGSDDAPTRTRLALRVQQDVSFAQMAYAWADRFQPLADSLQPAHVPENLWQRIQNDVNSTANVVGFGKRSGRSVFRRPAWIATGLLAAASVALALLVGPGLLAPPALEMGSSVVLAQTQTGSYTIEFTKDFSKVRVQTLSASLPQDRVHELWIVPEGGKAPRSLGVLARAGAQLAAVPADVIPLLKDGVTKGGVTLAISLEPLGGAPQGTPTGPILMTGALRLAKG
jgi:anti-sigma-K factor RskA